MKLAVLALLACQIAIVLSISCQTQTDCPSDNTACGEGFEYHCVDTVCKCLHESPISCHDDDDCERAHHNHEHCGLHNSREWKCEHHQCTCLRD